MPVSLDSVSNVSLVSAGRSCFWPVAAIAERLGWRGKFHVKDGTGLEANCALTVRNGWKFPEPAAFVQNCRGRPRLEPPGVGVPGQKIRHKSGENIRLFDRGNMGRRNHANRGLRDPLADLAAMTFEWRGGVFGARNDERWRGDLPDPVQQVHVADGGTTPRISFWVQIEKTGPDHIHFRSMISAELFGKEARHHGIDNRRHTLVPDRGYARMPHLPIHFGRRAGQNQRRNAGRCIQRKRHRRHSAQGQAAHGCPVHTGCIQHGKRVRRELIQRGVAGRRIRQPVSPHVHSQDAKAAEMRHHRIPERQVTPHGIKQQQGRTSAVFAPMKPHIPVPRDSHQIPVDADIFSADSQPNIPSVR